jgi:hypothetical protein
MNAQHPMSFMGNQPMMSPQMQNPYAGQGHGFYQNPGQQPNSRTLFPRLSVATQTTIPGDVTLAIFDKVVK